MQPIVMVDLHNQYLAIKNEIDEAIQRVIDSGQFIKGVEVELFEKELAAYLDVPHVVSCANGTDALMLALRSLDLQPGDEVIVPSYTFIATAEVVALLGLTPVFADVDPNTFNIDVTRLEQIITTRTRAIIPVHLFGLCANMEAIMNLAEKYGLFVIEDVAQALGASCYYRGTLRKAGTIGHIAATSFFPSKNLGCFGDGGAIITCNEQLAHKARLIANHGAEKKYYHLTVGVNSRLDTIQAAILRVKLKYLDSYIDKRKQVALQYHSYLSHLDTIKIPYPESLHTFNQYTIIVNGEQRDMLRNSLQEHQIPTAIYYPLPLHLQPVFANYNYTVGSLLTSEYLSQHSLSLPMHTELDMAQIAYIAEKIKSFCIK